MTSDDLDDDRTVAGDDLEDLADLGNQSDRVPPDMAQRSVWSQDPETPSSDPFDDDRTIAADRGKSPSGTPNGVPSGAPIGGDPWAPGPATPEAETPDGQEQRGVGAEVSSPALPDQLMAADPDRWGASSMWSPGQDRQAAPASPPDLGGVGMDPTDHTMAAPQGHPSRVVDPVLDADGHPGTGGGGADPRGRSHATNGGTGQWSPPRSSRASETESTGGTRALPAWLIPTGAVLVVVVVLVLLVVGR